MNWPGNYLVRTDQGNLTMTSDIIAIWAGMLGLAYLAGAGLYFETAGKRSRVSASHDFGRHARLRPVKIRHLR